MTSRTSGGLIKRNMTFTERQLRQMERMAAERSISTAAVMRELIDLGLKVEEARKAGRAAIEGLAVGLVARDAE